MTGVHTLFARAALSVVASLGGVVLATSPRIHRLLPSKFDRAVTVALVCSRLCFYWLIFFVLKLPLHGDVPSYYIPQANAALAGLIPYRDFISSYGPLHSYLDAAILTLWHNPLAIVLFSILVEATLLPIWLSLGRRFLGERSLRIACALYLTSPISLLYVCIDGQNTVILAVLLALALLSIDRNRIFLSSALFSTGIAVIKFLPLLFVPAFFLAQPRRWRWLAGFAATLLAGYSLVLFRHAPVFQPFTFEGSIVTAGDLPYFIESVLGIVLPGRLWDALLLCAFAAVTLRIGYAVRRSSSRVNLRALTFGMIALILVLLLFSKKSDPAYLMMALFPMYLLFPRANRLTLIVLGVFNLAALVQTGIWYTMLGYADPLHLRSNILLGQPIPVLFFFVEIVLLAGYGWLLLLALRQINAPMEPDNAPPDEIGASASILVSSD